MFSNVWTSNAFEYRKICLSGKQMQWQLHGGDTYSKWCDNIKKQNLITYKPEDVSYSYNSHGFRTEEYNNEDVDILALGCSFTEGIGIKNEDIWINKLANYLNLSKVANFGIGGCGIETLSRAAHYAINVVKIKPKIIIAFFPHLYRTEGFINNLDFSEPIFDFLPQQPFFSRNGYEQEWQNYVKNLNIKNRLHALIKEVIFLNTLSKSINAKFIWHTWASFLDCSNLMNKINEDELINLRNNNILTFNNNNGEYSVGIFDTLKFIAPEEVLTTALSDKCLWNFKYSDCFSYLKNISKFTEELPKEQIARDFMHPGPLSHLVFAKSAAEIIIDKNII